jgi:hypothetical protein
VTPEDIARKVAYALTMYVSIDSKEKDAKVSDAV